VPTSAPRVPYTTLFRSHPHVLGTDLIAVLPIGADPAQQGPHPSKQFGQPEGLGHVVVSTGVQADHEVHLVGTSSQDEDRHRHLLVADPPRHVQAVHVRQAQIEYEQVSVGSIVHGTTASAVHRHVIPLTCQCPGQRLGNSRVIFC